MAGSVGTDLILTANLIHKAINVRKHFWLSIKRAIAQIHSGTVKWSDEIYASF